VEGVHTGNAVVHLFRSHSDRAGETLVVITAGARGAVYMAWSASSESVVVSRVKEPAVITGVTVGQERSRASEASQALFLSTGHTLS